MLLWFCLLTVGLTLIPNASGEIAENCGLFRFGNLCPLFPPQNIIAEINGVSSKIQCQKECQMMHHCSNFTWTSFDNNDDTRCFLLKSCETLTPCGTEDCPIAVSGPVTPTFGEACCDPFVEVACAAEGIIDVQFSISTPAECETICRDMERCYFWTLAATTCYLYNTCESTEICPDCSSGRAYPGCMEDEAEEEGRYALVLGGNCDGAILCTQVEMITQNLVCTPEMPELPDGKEFLQAVYVGGKVIVCGGGDTNVPSTHSSCYSFILRDSETEWKQEESMVIPRQKFGMTSVGGNIYATGGFGGLGTETILRSVEVFSWDEGWQIRDDLQLPEYLTGHCAVAVDNTDLYVLGGQVTAGVDPITTVRKMTLQSNETNLWETVSHMIQARWHHACTVTRYEGKEGILVAGGVSSTTISTSYDLNTVEFFYISSNQWIALSPLTETRFFHTLTILKGVPMIAGGYTGSSAYSAVVEEFTEPLWEKKANLKLGRKNHAMISVPVGQLSCQMKDSRKINL